MDPVKRAALFIKMNDLVIQNVVVIPVLWRNGVVGRDDPAAGHGSLRLGLDLLAAAPLAQGLSGLDRFGARNYKEPLTVSTVSHSSEKCGGLHGRA